MRLTRRQMLLAIAATLAVSPITAAAPSTWAEVCELAVRTEQRFPSNTDDSYTNILQWNGSVMVVFGQEDHGCVAEWVEFLQCNFSRDGQLPILAEQLSVDGRTFAFAVPGTVSEGLRRQLPLPAFARWATCRAGFNP